MVFQGFPLCEVLLVYSILLGQYFTRVLCSISRFDTLDILSVLAVIGLQYNCSHTPSTRSISAASTTAILSVVAARNKYTRYPEHTWNFCCDAGCYSCCSCCCCPSGESAVDVPPSPAASEGVPMLARFATVCLFNSSTLYNKQQYYCCTPDTTVNTTTVGRCVGA